MSVGANLLGTAAIDAVASGTSTVISDGINGNIQSGKDLGLSFASGFTSSLFSSATGFLLKKFVFFDFGVDQFESRPRGEKKSILQNEVFHNKGRYRNSNLTMYRGTKQFEKYVYSTIGWVDYIANGLYHLERPLSSGNDE